MIVSIVVLVVIMVPCSPDFFFFIFRTCFSSKAEHTIPKDPFPMAFNPLYRASTRKVLFMMEYEDDCFPPAPAPAAERPNGTVELPRRISSSERPTLPWPLFVVSSRPPRGTMGSTTPGQLWSSVDLALLQSDEGTIHTRKEEGRNAGAFLSPAG